MVYFNTQAVHARVFICNSQTILASGCNVCACVSARPYLKNSITE